MAGSNEIRIDVVATDDASQVLEDVTDKVEGLEQAKAKVEVEADTGTAERDIEGVATEAERLDAVDPSIDVTTTGDTVSIGQAATDVDRLGASAAGAESGLSGFGQSLNTTAGYAAGLADPIAESNEQAGQAIGVFYGLAGAAEQLGPSLGMSASAASTMATALGIAGVAVGAGVALWSAYSKEQEQAEAAAKQMAETMGNLNDAMAKGDIEGSAEAMLEAFPNIAEAADNMGISVAEANAGLRGNQDALIAQVAANEAAGTAGEGQAWVLEQLVGAYNNASGAAAETEATQSELEGSFRDTAAGVQAEKDALLELVDARLGAADSRIAAENANRSFTESVAASVTAQNEYNTAVANFGPTSTEAATASQTLTEATYSERDAAIEAANAAVQHQTDLSNQAGIAVSAEAQMSALNSSLLESARVATPAARAEIIRYIADVNGISEERATEIVANGDTAAAEKELNDAARDREATITAKVYGVLDKTVAAAIRSGGSLDLKSAPMAMGRNTGIPPSMVTQPGAVTAFGLGAAEGASWLGAVSGGGVAVPVVVQNTYKIDVHVAANAYPAEVGRAIVNDIRAFERSAGKAWRAA